MDQIVIDGQKFDLNDSLEDLLEEVVNDQIIKPCYIPGNFPWKLWI